MFGLIGRVIGILAITGVRLLEYVLIAYIILGWFVFFGAIKDRDGFFFRIYMFLMDRIEPILIFVRRFVPSIGMFDLSTLVIFIILQFVEFILIRLFSYIS